MNHKLKIFFGFLIFFAIISVFSLTDYFHKGKASIFNIKKLTSNLSFQVETDADHDGLADIDETYWNTDFQNKDTDGDGFLDGEEVASGHDPTIKGPNDLLSDMNLTDKLAQLTTAGLAEGSLKPGSAEFDKSLSDLSAYATDNATIAINTVISQDTLKIVSKTKENQSAYLDQMYAPIKNFIVSYGDELRGLELQLNTIGLNGFKDPDVIQYFKKEQKIFSDIFDKTKGISVPENWKNEHLTFLGELKIAVGSNKAIANGKKDPLKAVMALEYLAEIFDRMPDWANAYVNKNRSEGVNNTLIESLTQ